MTKKFGILGPKNTFTDLAAHKYAQEAHITLQERYFSTIMGLVKEVSNGRLNSGIVPYKNSIGGSVQETHEALKRYEVSVTTKIVLPIEHALVGLSKAKKSDITAILSHPQALRQCHQYIKKNFPHALQEETPSTMAAYEQIKQDDNRHMAAIVPYLTAQKEELNILDAHIQDKKGNKTTFIIIQAATQKQERYTSR